MDMDFLARALALVDVETSGNDELQHEILEIGLILARQHDLSVLEEWNVKVRPHHIENAAPVAIALNGYSEAEWKDARELAEVMPVFSEKTKDAVLAAYNIAAIDWPFLKQAFRVTGVPNLMDYHCLDIMSLAWAGVGARSSSIRLSAVVKLLGVPPEQEPHRAINGARMALEVLRKLTNK